MNSIFDKGLEPTDANNATLTPLDFLARTASVYPEYPAVIHGATRRNWQQTYERCRRLASALADKGVGKGDTVAAMLPNIPPMLECHFGIPMLGAVLNALNTRLDAKAIAFMLEHGEAKVLIADREFGDVINEAVGMLDNPPQVIDVNDPEFSGAGTQVSDLDYDAFVASGDPAFDWQMPENEWDAISLCYTSGTTGNPKGVVYHHRGAYENAMGNQAVWSMGMHPVYLWTLPMFHCNGWAYTWAITAVGGTHVCLREVDSQEIYRRIEDYGVTHMCGAPVVMNLLIQDLGRESLTLSRPAQFALGGAAPPSSVIRKAEEIGFQITHLYGLTETFGPSTLCVPQPEWQQLPLEERALKMSRQGVSTHGLDEVAVLDMVSGEAVPADGKVMGEICIRGNTVMKGYLKNEEATEKAFSDGWFHTGDLAVMHPDHYVEIRDRAKDVIISGGENISSLEVEEVLYRHPKVSEAAVVAMADEKWGEVPCAFINPIDDGEELTPEEIIAFCREQMAHFKAPRKVVLGELPKTATGKIRKNILRDTLPQ